MKLYTASQIGSPTALIVWVANTFEIEPDESEDGKRFWGQRKANKIRRIASRYRMPYCAAHEPQKDKSLVCGKCGCNMLCQCEVCSAGKSKRICKNCNDFRWTVKKEELSG